MIPKTARIQKASNSSIRTGANAQILSARIEIMKVPLSLHIALTAIFGSLLAGSADLAIQVPLFLSLFLLATGSACLNNSQDRYSDAHCERTKHRAIPSGRLSAQSALVQGCFLLAAGSLLLLIQGNPPSFFLGVAAVVLYVPIYTRLKRKTVLAVIPGAVCGMLPPLIGWYYNGGQSVTPVIILMMLMIGVWQIPHYWIILIMHQDNRFHQAAPPTMLNRLRGSGLRRNAYIWVSSFACLTLLPVLFGIVRGNTPALLLVINAVILQILSINTLLLKKTQLERLLHIYLNSSLMIALLLQIVYHIV